MYASLTSSGAQLNYGNTISDLTAGTDYTVTLECRKNSGLEIGLNVDGVTYNTIPLGGDTSWRTYSFTFTAIGNSAALTLEMTIPGSSADGVMLDVFTIAPASGVCTS